VWFALLSARTSATVKPAIANMIAIGIHAFGRRTLRIMSPRRGGLLEGANTNLGMGPAASLGARTRKDKRYFNLSAFLEDGNTYPMSSASPWKTTSPLGLRVSAVCRRYWQGAGLWGKTSGNNSFEIDRGCRAVQQGVPVLRK